MLPANTPIRHIERHDLRETFADSLGTASFDGNTVRIELCVQRLDPLEPARPPSASQHPVCRLVLAPGVAVALYNQLTQLIGIMEGKGLVALHDGKPQTIN